MNSGTCLWSAGEAGGEIDCTGDWFGEGENKDWFEESGLQFGSILRVGGGMSAPGKPAGQNDPAGSLKVDQQNSSDRLRKMKSMFFYLTFLVNSIRRSSKPRNLNY